MISKVFTAIKNSRRLQVILVILFIFIFLQGYHIYHSYTKQQEVKQATLNYLRDEKAYNIAEDIARVDVYLASLKERNFMTTVIFSDAADVIYFYAFEPDSKQIKQIDAEYTGEGEEPQTFKHRDKN